MRGPTASSLAIATRLGRSPPVVPYGYALECAMDEMAFKLGIDPIEFRRINDTVKSPVDGKPYSSRSLTTCYEQAA
jgi:xanthine dehydrogenase YagR molybdenum-binding subunit